VSNSAAESLLTSLHHRTHALANYIKSLRAATSGAAEPFRAALDLFGQYAKAVRKQADYLYGREADEGKKVLVVEPLLADLLLVERHVDQLFARSHQLDVPRALARAVGKELESLGIGDLEPVLTIGPPGNYETFIADLYEFLFVQMQLPAPRRPKKAVTMLSLPYIEGTRALWLPVAVGHEVAHLALHNLGLLEGLDTASWIDQARVGKLKDLPSWLHEELTLVPGMQNILHNWVTEIMCDLYGVYRFGPAGVAAQSEFLAAIGSANIEQESHPPGVYRASVMAASIDRTEDQSTELVETWNLWATQAVDPDRPDWMAYLISEIDAHLDEIRQVVVALFAAPYDITARSKVVEYLRDRLQNHVPGTEEFSGELVTDADILNAGWLVRQQLNDQKDHATRERLAEVLDALVGKAIDTLDFVTMWRQASRGPTVGPKKDVNDKPNVAPTGGVLPSTEVLRRLHACRDVPLGHVAHPLVVTPMLDKAGAGTGLDVRLSRTFITFKRSSTASFDVLDERQDPREIQEVVEKDWGGSFILHPGELVLAATLEYLVLPGNLTAQVITRSSYGRLGLLSATAVQVHPHFKGCLTLELVNLGQMPLTLTPGQRVAQLVFSSVDPPATAGDAKYAYPIGPQFSKVREDDDVEVLVRLRKTTTGRK
jgi:deoxycytidine triphosphate deaminase